MSMPKFIKTEKKNSKFYFITFVYNQNGPWNMCFAIPNEN